MTIVSNTFFWMLFFMIGYAAMIDCIEDIGERLTANFFGRSVPVVVQIVFFAMLLMMLIRMLRTSGLQLAATANALRIGLMVYTSWKLKNVKGALAFAALIVASYYPWAYFKPLWMLDMVLLTAIIVGVNHFREWMQQSTARFALAMLVVNLANALFNVPLYGGAPLQSVVLGCVSTLGLIMTYLYSRLLDYRKQTAQQLHYDNEHDQLTEISSLQRFEEDFEAKLALGRAGGVNTCHLAIIDIDHFKKINDTYGHLAGNEVLIAFAKDCETYLAQLETGGSVYRVGGEEFGVLIGGGLSDLEAEHVLATYLERLRKLKINYEGHQIQITVTVGLTRVLPTDDTTTATFERADFNLYRAKRNGRNQLLQGN